MLEVISVPTYYLMGASFVRALLPLGTPCPLVLFVNFREGVVLGISLFVITFLIIRWARDFHRTPFP